MARFARHVPWSFIHDMAIAMTVTVMTMTMTWTQMTTPTVSTMARVTILCSGLNGDHVNTQRENHAYTHSCIYSCIHTFIHSWIHTFMHTLIHSCIHTFIHSYIHTLMLSYIHALVHSCTHTSMRSYIRTFIHSCINIFVHSYVTYDDPGLSEVLQTFSKALQKLSKGCPRDYFGAHRGCSRGCWWACPGGSLASSQNVPQSLRFPLFLSPIPPPEPDPSI